MHDNMKVNNAFVFSSTRVWICNYQVGITLQ
jgi:hypothetical protein